ncbi:MAG: hypothetical protein RL520_412 [Pseudomonadota bacterium]
MACTGRCGGRRLRALVKGALDFTALFNFYFGVMDFSNDFSSGANDQTFLADDGVVQLASDIDHFGGNPACDSPSGANEHFLSSQIAFNHTIDHSL